MSETSFFRNTFAQNIFNAKYRHEGAQSWDELSETLVHDVCQDWLTSDEKAKLIEIHTNMQFIAGGRYLYYAGRPNRFYNNCFLLKAENDTRQDWADLSWRAESSLMTGGGIGIDYSVYRESGSPLSKTGGTASGPIAKMKMINEIGRFVMQGGARRSAIYASLNWRHGDAEEFLHVKDWNQMSIPGKFEDGTPITIGALKEKDFNFWAPLDMTNISLNYDNAFLEEVFNLPIDEIERKVKAGEKLDVKYLPQIFLENVRQAMMTGEPGFSFNFFDKENETLRNACTEVTSEDDSDVCNLGSLNMSRYETIAEFAHAVRLATKFLVCGTLRAHLPYAKNDRVREKNRRLGLGLMGVHEWLLKRGYRYEVVDELKEWLAVYRDVSDQVADHFCDQLGISRPVAKRAIAPTGTIGIMACTTTGIEPLFATAYKRRYLKSGHSWHYEYVIDGTAKELINKFSLKPDDIESALDLASNPIRRIEFQAGIQDYVDMSISSTINLPAWGSSINNEEHVTSMAMALAEHSPRLRGMTVYPDGSRGGQPLTPVPFEEALALEGEEFEEVFMDVCDLTGTGTCSS